MFALSSQRLDESTVLTVQLNPLLVQYHDSVINLNIKSICRNFGQNAFVYLLTPRWFNTLNIDQKVADVFDECLFIWLARSCFKQCENVV